MPRARPVASRAGAPAEGRELRARGQRTVRKLLDAGNAVFGSRGFHAARVDDIVKAAKLSHGTFYLYFSSKEDLFRALALDVSEEMAALAGVLGELSPDEHGYRVLREWLEQFAALHRRYRTVIRAWTEAEIESSEFGRLGANLLGGFVAALGERIAASKAAVDDPQLAALAIVAMVERCNYYAMTGQVPDGDALHDMLADIAFASLFGAGARPKMTLASGSRRTTRRTTRGGS